MSGCRACGAAPPEGARFCPSCGAPVRDPGAPGDRRLVTVLFAQLVGIADRSANLDPEAVRDLLERCFAELTTVVEGHGGAVDKVVGHELMAVFGVPTVHEDDAERAVRAALDARRALSRLDATLGVRVGINSGEVLAGPVGPGQRDTVIGDAVNTAHRLLSVAAPGEVLVGERTWLATRATVEYESRRVLRVRGKRAELRAHAAVATLGLPGERPWQSRTAPMVGRTAELTALRAAARHAFLTSTPQLVTVAGEAGTGKTRLVLELQAELWRDLPSGLFLWGRCPSYGAPVFWPLAQVLRDAFGIDVGDPRQEAFDKLEAGLDGIEAGSGVCIDATVRRRTAQLLGLAGEDGADGSAPPERSEELLRAAQAVFLALATTQPTVVVLDDLHWARPALLENLHRFVASTTGVPLLLVAVGRSEVVGWLPDDLPADEAAVVLGPLGDDDLAAMLRHLLAAPPHPSVTDGAPPVGIDPATLDRLVSAAGGNPFFLEELVRYLLDRGALAPRDGRWSIPAEHRGALPDSVRAVLGARLEALSADERRLLQQASVAGVHFPAEAVAQLGGWQRSRLDAVVRSLIERGILEQRPPDAWGDLAFRHVLTREVVYASMPLGARAAAHAQVAAWLERAFGMDLSGEALDRVANHYEQAVALGRQLDDRDPLVAGRAWVALVRAARQATAHRALADADRLYRRAREVAADEPAPEMVDALLDHGDVQAQRHQPEEARATYEQARRGAIAMGLADVVADADARVAALAPGDTQPPSTFARRPDRGTSSGER